MAAEGRWTSFSVAKSFTSTLVGAAIKDGYIKSVEEPVTKYIPELAGSGYDGVTIAQLLTMTSGVKWNEDYTDAKSDVARMFLEPVPAGEDPTVHYMKKLPRETAPGSKWVYKTGETNLIGVLVMRATKKPLADYLSEKVWRPYGMEQDAFWMVDPSGHEVSGCCLSVSCATMPGWASSRSRAARAWCPAIGSPNRPARTPISALPGRGYGYQWWTYPGGPLRRAGHFRPDDPGRSEDATVIAVSAAARQGERPRLRHRADGVPRQIVRGGGAANPRQAKAGAHFYCRPVPRLSPGRGMEGQSTRSKCPVSNPETASARIRSATTSGAFTVSAFSPGNARARIFVRVAPGSTITDAHAADVATSSP
jgi:hypothetical protein